jgi:hypothetical protein
MTHAYEPKNVTAIMGLNTWNTQMVDGLKNLSFISPRPSNAPTPIRAVIRT